jgi:pimeloyl-ACP methyl ester carboxylesterase
MFQASDGTKLDGRLFGTGDIGIVLSHMGEPESSQADWFSFARDLADGGYRVLTYDRRGVCPGGLAGCSEGNDVSSDHWKDVLGAVAYMHSQGAVKVIAVGASLGAMASLRAAEEPSSGIDGLIWIAGVLFSRSYQFQQEQVHRLSIPILVISAAGDPYGAFVDARILDSWLAQSRGLLLPESHEHGTAMLQEDADPSVRSAILGAVMKYLDSFLASVQSTAEPLGDR